MVLLHLLHQLAQKHKWRLAVAHLNHKLRGRHSDADESLVHQTVRKLGLQLISENADVRSLARRQKLSIEMAARKLRHDFLSRTAARLKIPSIAVAHHADDQVELFFLRLLRGSGGEGLAGMKWRNASSENPKIELVRPLLGVAKEDLKAFARENKICFREDASNAALDFQRNRIRHELLPLLRRKYQSAPERAILRLMDIVGEEAEFVGQAANDWLSQKKHKPFAKLPLAVQRRVVQLELQRLKINADFNLIEQLRNELERPVAVAPDVAVLRDKSGRIQLVKTRATEFRTQLIKRRLLGKAGRIIFDGICFDWRIDSGKYLPHRRIVNIECFDADKIGSSIVLRHWQPGDRFQPIGMKLSVKLQDLFTNFKIPRVERTGLAVATTAGGEIFWVQKLRISERFKLTGKTLHRLQWRWEPG